MNFLFNDGEIKPIIPSLSYSQDMILNGIIRLYIPSGRFEIDATYNRGMFYRSGKVPAPIHKYEIAPRVPEVEEQDCRALPHDDNTISSIMLDPPFITYSGKGCNLWERYSGFETRQELFAMYRASLKEACRVLKPKGILIFKCQDGSYGNQFDPMSIEAVFLPAKEIGFRPEDIFILASKARPVRHEQAKKQRHSRKYHSYFWVFRKIKRKGIK